ncbi:MAG: GAF domain-containing SpoIIE family protein phosphatase [Planctomycetota bacterium]|nr:GAF domain-containing SpoIIE family protein phosphatase [Planctomycetota bacterium]
MTTTTSANSSPGDLSPAGASGTGKPTPAAGGSALVSHGAGVAGGLAAAAGSTTPGVVAGRTELSITDFLTDGSLARLCSELQTLTGLPVELRDAKGRRVVKTDTPPGWRVDDAPDMLDALVLPLMVAGRRIGSLCLGAGDAKLAPDARAVMERTLRLLGSAAVELCEREFDSRDRIKELSALFKLSSLLTRAPGMERVLAAVLDTAIDTLELDCGSIVLMPDDDDDPERIAGNDEAELVLMAARGLSSEWLADPRPLSKDRVFDRLALQGEVVVSTDLAHDDRVNEPGRLNVERLGAAIHAGMVFKGRPVGVIRLYARSPREFELAEQQVLRSIAQQAAVAVQQARLLKIEQEEQRIQRQIQLAADVQRRMLPRGVPNIKGLDVAARYIPSFELGGDFYDFIDLNGHFGLVVGDVVGKGVAAALLMSAVRASLRAHAEGVYDLDNVVAKVNTALCRDTLDNEFATLWYGVIDPNTLRLTYCSAGHEPPLVVRVPTHRAPTNADIDELSVGGMVVGIDRSQRYQRAVYDLQRGDVLIAYTDGMTDQTNFRKEKFGKKRLRQAILDTLAAEPEASAAAIAERLLWHLRQFAGLAPRADDETLVVVRVPRTRGG